MSFILDALKKSENERQRQAGPALFEVKVAPPKARFPLWGIVLGVLLGANLIVLLVWLATRGSPSDARTANAPAQVAAAPAATAPAPAAVAPATSSLPPIPVPAAVGPNETPYGDELPASGAGRADPMLSEEPDEGEINAADYEPAVEPDALPREPAVTPGSSRVSRGLPTREAAIAQGAGDIPEMRVDLLAYHNDPAKRFVLINMQRMREGDSLPNGARVDRITEGGAEMSWRGHRFVLEQE